MHMLIDGNNLAHRVFHTPQGTLTKKDGTPSGVILGVINSIKGLLEKFPDTEAVTVMWDGGRSEWRKELYPEYKAQRDYGEDDEEKAEAYQGLWNQIEELHKNLSKLAIDSVKLTGYEADDLIALMTKQLESLDKNVLIVTSDKDMLQLVSEKTSVYSPYRDIVIGLSNFVENTGVELNAYMGFRALVGDTSDNIIGVPGIGEKTAQNLMKKYGHIDSILGSTGAVRNELMKSKRNARIFEPENLKRLGINNKIMNFNYIPKDEKVMEYIQLLSESTPESMNTSKFKRWVMEWQFLSIISNFMPWVTPFMALGEE
ncbi:flap endonuclease [Bacillus phage vB_BsuM-Goe16]|nr:flap endonuclease [Bacillus phage vB_BsuM-Goe16]